MSITICKDDLIREAKVIMINRGFPFYNNKRLGQVPRETVEEILGISLVERSDING